MNLGTTKRWWLSIATLVMLCAVTFSAAAGWVVAQRHAEMQRVALSPVHAPALDQLATPAPKR